MLACRANRNLIKNPPSAYFLPTVLRTNMFPLAWLNHKAGEDYIHISKVCKRMDDVTGRTSQSLMESLTDDQILDGNGHHVMIIPESVLFPHLNTQAFLDKPELRDKVRTHLSTVLSSIYPVPRSCSLPMVERCFLLFSDEDMKV